MVAALLLERIFVMVDFSVACSRAPVQEDAEIYVGMPMPEHGMGDGLVWKLKKFIYGLREAALRFLELLERVAVGLGFEACKAEPAIYRHREK
eukprot:2751480-Pyramimonas_sp.AAC.1